MAKLEFDLPDDFTKQLNGLLKDTDAIMEKVLEAGGAEVAKEYRSALKFSIGRGTKKATKSTGELVSSVGVSPMKTESNGYCNVKIGFNEPRRKQPAAPKKNRHGKISRSYYTATNYMIANVLEYGKSGQPPRPFVKKAKNRSKKKCIDTMQKTLESEVRKRR